MEKLSLCNVTANDSGWYSCIVTNRYGQTHRSAWFSVLHTSKNVTNSSHLAVVSGGIIGVFIFLAAALLCGLYVYSRFLMPWKASGWKNKIKFMSNELYLPANIPVDAKWEISRQK